MEKNKVAPDSYPPPAYGGPGVYPPGPPPAYPEPNQQGFSYSNTTTVQTTTSTIHEPAPMVIQREPKPDNYLILSLITLACFSPLFGLFALCFSMQSNNAYHRGDVHEAKRKGITARNISIFGIVVTFVGIVVAIAVMVLNLAIIPAFLAASAGGP